MNFIHWFHHLFNPHCLECLDEQQESKVCKTCEVLRIQLEAANAEKKRLLDSILKDNVKPPETSSQEPQIIRGRHTSFAVHRQMLEAEDRHKAQILAKTSKEISEVPKDNTIKTTLSSPQSIEELEKELGVSNA